MPATSAVNVGRADIADDKVAELPEGFEVSDQL